jgi:two-component system LytT family response regulator
MDLHCIDLDSAGISFKLSVSMENNPSFQQIIEVKTSSGFKLINSDHIIFLEARKKFSIAYLDDNTSIVTFHLLKWFCNQLHQPYFFRNHNSYIVNCSFVDSYTCHSITLKNKRKIPLSRSRILLFKENQKKFMSIQD